MKAPSILQWNSTQSSLELEIRVITPMFGGGVHINPTQTHHKDVDPRTPVRGAAIRGQLRFWWRATRGALMASQQAMLARETEIWGNASAPGVVSLDVTQPDIAGQEPVYETYQANNGAFRTRSVKDRGALAYGAFSLQPQSEHLRSQDPAMREPGKLRVLSGPTGVRLRFPESVREDVERAVAAWTAFGGLGGRTRRGFGAVSKGDIGLDQMKALIGAPASGLDKVPSLHGARIETLQAEYPSALAALQAGLLVLQRMRQAPGYGRNPGQENNRPGRSRWPEPEVIRVLTNQSNPQHRARLVGIDKMPRWRFGMPIVFHFQGGGDPQDTQLRPRGHERMASPLIIRPFKTRSGKYRCLALVLNVPGMSVPLELHGAPGTPIVDGNLTGREPERISPLNGSPDALTAFLAAFAIA